VVIGDEVKTLAGILPFDVLLDRAEIIADVQFPGGLHPTENARAIPEAFANNGRGHHQNSKVERVGHSLRE
jgi:hypothetical protein